MFEIIQKFAPAPPSGLYSIVVPLRETTAMTIDSIKSIRGYVIGLQYHVFTFFTQRHIWSLKTIAPVLSLDSNLQPYASILLFSLSQLLRP